jgi:hypothetical protein
MVKRSDNAFPVNWGENNFYSGMTIEQYYAAKAMQGILANPATMTQIAELAKEGAGSDLIAIMAFRIANAMIDCENDRGEKNI